MHVALFLCKNSSYTALKSKHIMSENHTEPALEPEAQAESINNETMDSQNSEANAPETTETAVDTAPDKVASLEAEVAELKDKYLRLYSEFDNYRKRVIKEKSDIKILATGDVMSKLLEVVDDFDRTQKAIEHTEDIEVIKEGMILIFSKLAKVLENQGLKPMQTIGNHFDPDFHESIASIPAPDDDSKGKVMDEVQKGYFLHDKPIRFAKVVIGA